MYTPKDPTAHRSGPTYRFESQAHRTCSTYLNLSPGEGEIKDIGVRRGILKHPINTSERTGRDRVTNMGAKTFRRIEAVARQARRNDS
jgi:hypothetical protein